MVVAATCLKGADERRRRCSRQANCVPCRREQHRPPDRHRHRHVDGREGRTGERDRVEAEDLTWRRRRCRGGAGAASLVLALGFLALCGVLIPAMVQPGGHQSHGAPRGSIPSAVDLYAADGAVDGAIQYLRQNPACGTLYGNCPSPVTDPSCPGGTGILGVGQRDRRLRRREAQARWTAQPSRSDRRADRHRRRQTTRRREQARFIRDSKLGLHRHAGVPARAAGQPTRRRDTFWTYNR